jgi:hypothetical protein
VILVFITSKTHYFSFNPLQTEVCMHIHKSYAVTSGAQFKFTNIMSARFTKFVLYVTSVWSSVSSILEIYESILKIQKLVIFTLESSVC